MKQKSAKIPLTLSYKNATKRDFSVEAYDFIIKTDSLDSSMLTDLRPRAQIPAKTKRARTLFKCFLFNVNSLQYGQTSV